MRTRPGADLDVLPVDGQAANPAESGSSRGAHRGARRALGLAIAVLFAAAVGYTAGSTRDQRRPTDDPLGPILVGDCDGRLIAFVGFGRDVSFLQGEVEVASPTGTYFAPAVTDERGRIRLDSPSVVRHHGRLFITFSPHGGAARTVSADVVAC